MYSIEADLHTHTVASTHAYSTVLENLHHAAKIGLRAIASTDHAPDMQDAPHIWHFMNLDALPREWEGVTLLRGAEVNILDADGRLDLPDSVLSDLDWVVASMHRRVCTARTMEETTRAYLKVAENPLIDLIGHSGTPAFAYDYRRVIPVFGEAGKIVEINDGSLSVRPESRKNCVEIARLCKEYRVPVAVDSDAHFCMAIGEVSGALEMLKEIDFPEELILNASADRLFSYLAAKHGDDWRAR